MILSCPACRMPMVAAPPLWRCDRCHRLIRWRAEARCFDAAAGDAPADARDHQVALAYGLYAHAYAPLALLNMIAVWRASLGRLVEHYARALDHGHHETLDIAIGDGALTATALRRLRRRRPHRAQSPDRQTSLPPVARERDSNTDDAHVIDTVCSSAPRLLGVDLSPAMLCRAQERLAGHRGCRFMHADVGALPFADRSWSRICCFGGLHVFAQPERAMAEMGRVLAPGGTFHASILTHPRGHFGPGLVRRYLELGFLSTDFTRDRALTLLTSVGLTITTCTANGQMLLISAVKPQ